MNLLLAVSLCRYTRGHDFDNKQRLEHTVHLDRLRKFFEPLRVYEHARGKLRLVQEFDRNVAQLARHDEPSVCCGGTVAAGPGTCRPRFESYTMRARAGRITITPCSSSMVMSISSPGVRRKYVRTSGGNTTPHVPPTFQKRPA